MSNEKFDLFKELTFESFKKMAQDKNLSPYGKIGFPDSYRKGKEENIFSDITQKLENLNKKRQVIVDIGPGCSDLPRFIIELCRRNEHTLFLIDSEEMLNLLPNESFITKIPSFYPNDCNWLFEKHSNKVNVIICYSVLHYIFTESSLFSFIDKSLALLAEGGEFLIGDIPNISKRKRFFSSTRGIDYHQKFTGSNEIPEVNFNTLEPGKIDDAVVLALLLRCRIAGFDSYILPQKEDLPMANRREDILIKKP